MAYRQVGKERQCDWIFADGAMHKHGNMGQGIYVDPARDFVGINFTLCPSEGETWSRPFTGIPARRREDAGGQLA